MTSRQVLLSCVYPTAAIAGIRSRYLGLFQASQSSWKSWNLAELKKNVHVVVVMTDTTFWYLSCRMLQWVVTLHLWVM